MSKSALILIDIQNIYFTEGPYLLFQPVETARRAAKILDYFRKRNLPVIHVQHAFNTTGYSQDYTYLNRIHSLVEPLESEKIVHKNKPSSFFETDLLEYLKQNEITEVVIAGMMSHMCIDTTVRACKDYNLKVTVIDDACTTKGLEWDETFLPAKTVHAVFMASLKGMFAEMCSTQKFLEKA